MPFKGHKEIIKNQGKTGADLLVVLYIKITSLTRIYVDLDPENVLPLAAH
jgi:hypothetical protein